MMKYGKKMNKCKTGKVLKLGSMKIDVNVFEISKWLMFLIFAIGCFLGSIISFFLFIAQFIVSIFVIVLNPVDLIDLLINKGFVPGKYCISSG